MDKSAENIRYEHISRAGQRRMSSRAPRYATLPNIMKAKKKPLDVVKPADLGVDVAPRLKTLKVAEPGKRKGGVMVKDVDELVAKLRNEAKVI